MLYIIFLYTILPLLDIRCGSQILAPISISFLLIYHNPSFTTGYKQITGNKYKKYAAIFAFQF